MLKISKHACHGSDRRSGQGGERPFMRRPFLAGGFGVVTLLAVFFVVVTFANGSFGAAIQEFVRLWYWVILLAGGFGLQLGLFVHIRERARERMPGVTAEVAASGTVSTGSMIACCSHALVNVLPVLGISAAATFLARYQLPLILTGVFSNLVGISIMLGIIQQHRFFTQESCTARLFTWPMRTIRNILILAGFILIALTAYLA